MENAMTSGEQVDPVKSGRPMVFGQAAPLQNVIIASIVRGGQPGLIQNPSDRASREETVMPRKEIRHVLGFKASPECAREFISAV